MADKPRPLEIRVTIALEGTGNIIHSDIALLGEHISKLFASGAEEVILDSTREHNNLVYRKEVDRSYVSYMGTGIAVRELVYRRELTDEEKIGEQK